MPISIPDRVLVFDYGEVISRSPSDADRATIVEASGSDDATFWPIYWAHRDELDHGTLSITDYWARVADDLHTSYTPAQVAELWVRDLRSWISVEPGTVELLAELHDGGTRMALLSNAGFDFGDPLRRAPYSQYFERVFVSAELGMLKPHPDVYRHVADELGIGFDQFVFVDNKAPNVEGAVALGATGHVFVGVGELRAFVEGLAAQR
ncbi:MAG: HAD-IA family hydrolase [Pseudolysinimonas sp.]